MTLLAIPVIGFVVASRRPGNRIGWLFLAAGLASGVNVFSQSYGLRALLAAPGSLPAGRSAMWLSGWTLVVPIGAFAFLLLLFPTGQLRSPRWRPAAWFVGGVFALWTAVVLVGATRFGSHPFSGPLSQAVTPPVVAALMVLGPAALVTGVAAVVVRFVRSAGEERLQLKWFAAAAVPAVVTFIASVLTGSAIASVLSSLAFLWLYAAIAIAVLKYRLYEIDIVISKAVLYGSLAVFITAVYAALVAGIGTLVGNRHSVLPVTVEADGIGRFGQDTEAAVYFCCLEALQNTAKYAHATQARVCLQAQNGSLRFTVSDDGTGYDARHIPMGSGLRNMADRLAALGGRLEVQSVPTRGTTITGHLPTGSSPAPMIRP